MALLGGKLMDYDVHVLNSSKAAIYQITQLTKDEMVL